MHVSPVCGTDTAACISFCTYTPATSIGTCLHLGGVVVVSEFPPPVSVHFKRQEDAPQPPDLYPLSRVCRFRLTPFRTHVYTRIRSNIDRHFRERFIDALHLCMLFVCGGSSALTAAQPFHVETRLDHNRHQTSLFFFLPLATQLYVYTYQIYVYGHVYTYVRHKFDPSVRLGHSCSVCVSGFSQILVYDQA